MHHTYILMYTCLPPWYRTQTHTLPRTLLHKNTRSLSLSRTQTHANTLPHTLPDSLTHARTSTLCANSYAGGRTNTESWERESWERISDSQTHLFSRTHRTSHLIIHTNIQNLTVSWKQMSLWVRVCESELRSQDSVTNSSHITPNNTH